MGILYLNLLNIHGEFKFSKAARGLKVYAATGQHQTSNSWLGFGFLSLVGDLTIFCILICREKIKWVLYSKSHVF